MGGPAWAWGVKVGVRGSLEMVKLLSCGLKWGYCEFLRELWTHHHLAAVPLLVVACNWSGDTKSIKKKCLEMPLLRTSAASFQGCPAWALTCAKWIGKRVDACLLASLQHTAMGEDLLTFQIASVCF